VTRYRSLKLRVVAGLSRSARTWIAVSMLAPLGMLAVSSVMLLELRRDAWERVEQTSQNLLQVLERDIARNIEIYGLSLEAVVDGLQNPQVMQADPALRQMILFDRATTAKDMGVLLVVDENGDSVVDARSFPPRKVNYADRDYFQAHKADANLGLHISRPLMSRLTGTPIIVLSRRINKADGSFGGIVLGTWKLAYFQRLFDRLSLGQGGAINLFHLDGTRLMIQPYVAQEIGVNVAGTPNFDRFRAEGRGSFVGVSVRDGVERSFAFTRIADLPLILVVGASTNAIVADWHSKALVISLIVLALSALTVGLTFLFGRELQRRTVAEKAAKQANAELSRLALTDSLTGLANRRRFDEVYPREWRRAERTGSELSLLMIDADHFKRFNDRYGHHVGDEVLQGLAQCLATCIHRPADCVYRIGGEEFALLLPGTDQDGALLIAERVHAAVAALEITNAGIERGGITVSVGLVCANAAAFSTLTPARLVQLADAALYEAKASGRNQTKVASRPAGQKAVLRVVAAAS
jgi:diguanylate cyclase (GGDEF)-like protein